MAYVTLHGGGGLWVMGSVPEVWSAVADESVYVDGKVMLRWAHTEEILLLDPTLVRGVKAEVPEEDPA